MLIRILILSLIIFPLVIFLILDNRKRELKYIKEINDTYSKLADIHYIVTLEFLEFYDIQNDSEKVEFLMNLINKIRKEASLV